MKKDEVNNNTKNFGIVFSIFFFLLSLYLFYSKSDIYYSLITLSAVFLMISFTYPNLFYYPNKFWMSFGYLIGSITTPILLSIIYFILIFPIGMLLRLFNKDVLDKKINQNDKTFWKSSAKLQTNLEKQY
ncbi:hypothetical protein IDH31_00180 [Pelagibacterales bacterium SAG-MED32]|nr:hypothetical protein [Pelagibacterales bacterium SAG-MED32]